MFFCQMLSSVLFSGVLLVLVGADQCPGGRCDVCSEQVGVSAPCCDAVVPPVCSSSQSPRQRTISTETQPKPLPCFTVFKMVKLRKWQNRRCGRLSTSCLKEEQWFLLIKKKRFHFTVDNKGLILLKEDEMNLENSCMFYVCRKFSALMENAAVLKVTCAARTDAPALKQVKSAPANITDPENTTLIQKVNKLLLFNSYLHNFIVHLEVHL